MNIFKLSMLPPAAKKLVFVTALAVIGVLAVNISQAAGIACPLKVKPGYNRGSYGQQRATHVHAGTDLIVGRQPVYAATSGTAVHRQNFKNGKGYGNYIDLHGSDGKIYRYAHLGSVTKTGPVNAGDQIGVVGDSGSPGSIHLHFEVRSNAGFGTAGTHSPNSYLDGCTPSGAGSTSAPSQNPSSANPTPNQSTTLTMAQVAAIINGPAGYENFQMTLKEKIQMFQHNRRVPNSCSNPHDWRSCDGVVGPATRRELLKVAEEFAGGGPSDDLTGNSPSSSTPPPVPQPGNPGSPGTSTCTGGCKPGTPGASNPGTPGASNPGTATQGSSGASGAPGTRGSSGTSGTSGTQGSKGTQGGTFIGGQSQSSSSSSASSGSKPPTSKQYVLRSHASGRCMDADGTTRGKDTQIWDCTGNSNQKWGLASDGTIRLAASGLCLEVEGGDTDNGSDVQIYNCNGGSHQRWQWNNDGTIRSTATGRCLDVKDNKTDNGTNLQIWDCYRSANQKWGSW